MITKHCTTRTNEVNSAYKNKNKDKQKFHKLYVHEEGVRPRKCKGSIPKKSSLKQPGRKTAVLMLPKRHQSIHFVTPDLTGFSLYVGRKRLRFTFSTHISGKKMNARKGQNGLKTIQGHTVPCQVLLAPE